MKITIALLISLFTYLPAVADNLSDSTFLRKLSLHIRGIAPTQQEYNELKAVPVHARKAFLQNKIKSYLKTTQHESRMTFRLSELFRLKTKGTDFDISSAPDSLTSLFSQIARENLSWDTLLTGKTYFLPPADPMQGFSLSDADFFKQAYENFPKKDENLIFDAFNQPSYQQSFDQATMEIKFSANDPRIAGALTTKRFLSRYTTTAINKNRRRAAAVFRIFLCDPMIPAIESGTNRKHEFVDAAFAQNFEVTDEMIAEQLTSNERHGTDPQCMSCHSKLDPLGRTFQGSGIVLHPDTFNGRLFYRRSNTETVDLPANGIGDIAKHITQQKEYADCQVKWFWEQFIGNNVPLSKQRTNDLVRAFNRVQRKTNDFIEYLVQQPEFRSRPQNNTSIVFSQVSGLLKRCDSCHAYEGYIPVFSQTPIGFSGKPEEQSKWLLKMKMRLELPRGHKDQMPEDRYKTWTEDEINLLLSWLNTGANDDNHKPLMGSEK